MLPHSLRQAARACGIALSYEGPDKTQIQPNEETVKLLIKELTGQEFGEGVINERRKNLIQDKLPKIIVCWDGYFPVSWISSETFDQTVEGELINENDSCIPVIFTVEDRITRTFEDKKYYRIKISTSQKIDFGYYDFELGGKSCLVISAPQKIEVQAKSWGIFAPVYALRSSAHQGVGGYKELLDVSKFIYGHGGTFVGTLPLLPVDHEGQDANHSPYSPLTRLFWNEIFLDVNNLPESTEKSAFLHPDNSDYVDYKTAYSFKKTVLEKAAHAFFEKNPEGTPEYKAYLSQKPYIQEYTTYRSQGNEDLKKFHLYAQYACHIQLKRLQQNGYAELYLDYPVGVDVNGFDAQQFAHLFLDGFSVGAPPDPLGIHGQNWGFKALKPDAIIKDRFSYFRATLQHYFSYAKMLRIDHVMALYRLYCIPENKPASKGAYIYYPFNALLAVTCLEAYRHQAVLIGENLGTVPEAVNDAMKNHGILRMWLLQFSMKEKPDDSFESIEKDVMAGINTHDMFPLFAYINGIDIKKLAEHGIISEEDKSRISKEREIIIPNWKKYDLNSILEKMAQSPAQHVIINMEDLWGEILPQNIPGTTNEYRNWSKKLSLPFEAWEANENIKQAFKILNKHRK
ncbi:MAG: hypothetical protein DI586_02960 [Micavibrio aeruginosavorus]|uniref:4-alpha-glucanotransferase n=1 Tax=Micavibrio aeruginosavorus TaxID=349221 RepID=A0A2W5FNS9_9BACT|nr:MAG: hypothetical protein DI586_02960 [Micavibrio aeruginosavorus]